MKIIIPILILFFLYACNNNLTSIGQDLIDNDSYVEIIKTKLNQTSTIKLDSFSTSTGYSDAYLTQVLIGKANDKVTGVTTSTPFFQVVTNITNIESYLVYDSTTFEIRGNNSIWGDTNQVQTFRLHQLKELPTISSDDYLFYSNDFAPYEETPLATTRLLPRKNRNKNYSFRVNDNLGKQLTDMLKNKDEIFAAGNTNRFLKFFRGLTIVPDESNTCIMGLLADSLLLKIHYHKGENEYTVQFRPSQIYKRYLFTNFQNQAKTPFSKLQKQTQFLPFEDAGKTAVLQGLSGYMMRVEIPASPVDDRYKTVIKAEIELNPKTNSFREIAQPASIGVYVTDKYNRLKSTLKTAAGKSVTGKLVKDPFNQEEDRYIIDITDYYNELTRDQHAETDNFLLIGLQTGMFGLSFDRLIIDEIPVLKVYYAKYE